MPNLLATAVSHILESLAAGDTATADHIEAHLNDPAALEAMFGDDDAPEEEPDPSTFSWSEGTHPRDDTGRFVSAGEVRTASRDPRKAEELRGKVTNPEQRKKLDEAIDGAAVPGRNRTAAHPTPEFHHEEGKQHAGMLRHELIKAIKDGDDDGVKNWRKKAERMAAIHWREAGKKATAQLEHDYPPKTGQDHVEWQNQFADVGNAFSDAEDSVRKAYRDLATNAEGMVELGSDGADDHDHFDEGYQAVLDAYDKAQNDVWDAVEKARDALGGKEKGHKLKRYFFSDDQPRGDADNAGHFAKQGGSSDRGSSEPAKSADKPKVAKGFAKRPKWASEPAMKSVLDIFDSATGHERTALDTALDRAGLLTSDAKTGDTNGYEKEPSADPETIRSDLAHGLASGYGTFAGKHPVDGIAKALEAIGAKPVGSHDEATEFDGAVHENIPGAFTGHAVKVVRPGWVLPGEDGRDVVLLKARVAKEGDGQKFADQPRGQPGNAGQFGPGGGKGADKPDTGEDRKADKGPDHTDAITADLAKQFPAEAKNAGLWGKVKGLAKSVTDRVNTFLVAHADQINTVAQLVDAAIVTPDDMKKLGVNPDGGQAVSDAFRDATGIGGNVGAKLIGLAVLKGWTAAKKLAGKKMADGATLDTAAEFLAGLIDAATEGMGLPKADLATIRAALADANAPAG